MPKPNLKAEARATLRDVMARPNVRGPKAKRQRCPPSCPVADREWCRHAESFIAGRTSASSVLAWAPGPSCPLVVKRKPKAKKRRKHCSCSLADCSAVIDGRCGNCGERIRYSREARS